MSNKREYSISNLITWLTVTLVSLSVGFSMTGASRLTGALTIPWWAGGVILSIIAGWVIVITTLIMVALTILDK